MNLLKIFLTLFIVFTNLYGAAQGANFVWAKRFGGNLNDNCSSVCDQAGNVYKMQGGITKFNSSGTQQWDITTAYVPLAISFDAAGDLYVVGYFNTTIDMDHGSGTYTVATAGGFDISVVKLSTSTGNFVWGGSMGSSGSDYDAIIFADASGNVYTGGTFSGAYDVDPTSAALNFTPAVGATDFFVSKLNTGGNLLWAKQFAGSASGWVGSIEADAAGDIYFSGSFSGTFDFDPGASVNNLSTSSNSDDDMYLGKLDATGNFVWIKQMGATGSDYFNNMELGTNGNLYCSGLFTGLVDFDSGSATLALNSGTSTNAFVAEFNSSGTPNWVRHFSGFYVRAMALDQSDGICLTGQFSGADFDPGPGTYSMTSNGGSWPDIYISKLSSSGNFLWAKEIGSLNEDGPNSISVDGANNIHVAGRFKTSCDFDPNGGSYVLTAFGGNFNYDAFMLKLCQTPDPSTVMGNNNLCQSQSETFSVTPLPNATYYTWTLPLGFSGTSSTHSILVTAGSASGNLTMKAGNTCGVSPTVTVAVIVDLCHGIYENSLSAESLYPNPSGGTVYLETSKNYELTILNSLGHVAHKSKVVPGKNALDLNELTKGIYFIYLSQHEETHVLKWVRQ